MNKAGSRPEQGNATRQRRLVFAFFAVAILLSMLREWNAPNVCLRSILASTDATTVR
jgi:hypothetical protein